MPRVQGWGPVRQAQPPPVATGWIQMLQTRMERQAEPGTALLALLVLGLGLACLGLLLALVSLGSRASLFAQVRLGCTPLPGTVPNICWGRWAEGKGGQEGG